MGGNGFGPGVGVGKGSPGVLACVAIIERLVPGPIPDEPRRRPTASMYRKRSNSDRNRYIDRNS